MATLTELVRKRRQSGGTVGGSLSYGLKERAKETFDPRRIFKQDGLLTALFPKLRAYKSGKIDSIKKSVTKLSAPEISSSEPILDLIQQNTKIYAKNSLVLPAIHRDVNVMRQNIIKLVKLKDGEATNKADMWFMKASTMEAAYENRLKTKSTKKDDKKPTIEKKEGSSKESGFIGQILDKVTGLLKPILSVVSTISKSLLFIISGISAVTLLATSIGRVLYKFLKLFVGSKIAKILGITALALGVNEFFDKFEGVSNTLNEFTSKLGGTLSDSNLGSERTGETVAKKEYSGQFTGSSTVDSFIAPYADTGAKVAAAGSAIAGANVAKQTYKSTKLAGKTATAILDARTMSVGQLAKSTPKTLWGKFLSFVAKKSPKLFGKIALKLAQAGALATIPVVGWVGAAINIGFSLWTAWELYELWREFNNLSDEQKDIEGSSPTLESTQTTEAVATPPPTPAQTASAANKPPLTKQDIVNNQEVEKVKNVDNYVNNNYGKETIDGKPGSRKMSKDELRQKAMSIYGVDKAMADRVTMATSGVKEQQRAAMRPQISVTKSSSTKQAPSSQSSGSLEYASVYDTEFLKLLGMSGAE